MVFKKSHGSSSIFGVTLNKKEQAALDKELKAQMAEFERNHSHELQASILYILLTEFGFSKPKLKKFYQLFDRTVLDLIARYELEDTDIVWLCTHKLKERGIDLNEWEQELRALEETSKSDTKEAATNGQST